MRKSQKKQAGEFIDLLSRAHGEIKKAIETQANNAALGLLEQCQEGAIKLGEMIEAAEGEECAAIPLLESYCEQVYQIYEGMCQGVSVNANEVYGKLSQSWGQVADMVENHIQARIEAVFLPYKASMWDSLESVWKAADQDPNCDAYVIPIPYYDKNPDGSFGKMHYEGGQYPSYVPITGYETFDFAAHHPDIMFIHNPYDEYNYVTSVHPFFYSKNLKKYTDKLVYIPYFVLGDLDPDNEEGYKWMEHFCTTPAVMYADQVIVQSEDVRKIYIQVMTRETGERTRPYWEKKILGLGSPKFDKVLEAQKEEQDIPEEWARILQKPDGSKKVVILYNTSVSALLNQGEKMLDKIYSVFRAFKEMQDDVALLWRPHPLIEATISSMRPQLWKKYKKMMEEYREQGWGIYDDSADLDRAIALCDGYYGDGSSLVQLCQKAGKPVMIQNVDILEYD